jgi:UTP--glucose-1-phosphate uridylyltransferase
MTQPDPALASLSPDTLATLEAYHFDEATFLALRARMLSGELNAEANRLTGAVTLPEPGDIIALPEPGSAEAERLAAIGQAALEAGHVGVIILNGGMATRFGGVVKGVVPVFDDLSFLALKLRDALRFGGKVDVILMNSFATDASTKAHLAAHDSFGMAAQDLDSFIQNISVRLTPQGAPFVEADGQPSLYAPGHGDLPDAIGRGALQRFMERGGRYLWMSNVDNVLATLDPTLLGAHIDAGVSMTVESAPRLDGDKGGMPARVDDHLQVVEHFRFPRGFDDSSIPVFNTNTFIFNAEALGRDFPLQWFLVEKSVDGKPAIQFERLAGELSAFLPTRFVAVSRDGASSRFLPIKVPADLEQHREALRAILTARGVL